MRRQWSGIAAAGIAKIAMLSTTAANFPMYVMPTPLCPNPKSSMHARTWFKSRLTVTTVTWSEGPQRFKRRASPLLLGLILIFRVVLI